MNGRKLPAALSGVAACAVLGTFLIGVPMCLVRLVGNPLPSALPTWSSVVAAVEGGVLPPGVAIGVVAVVVWIWWSQVALSFAVEVVAACRGRMAQPLPLDAFGMQPLVVRLVAIVVTAAGTLGLLAQPVLAATPSFAGISVPATTGEPAPRGAGEFAVEAPVGAANGSSPRGAPSAAVGSPAPPAPILALPLDVSLPLPAAQAAVSAPGSAAPILAPPQTPAAAPAALPVPAAAPAGGRDSPAAVQPLNAPGAAGAMAPGARTGQDAPAVSGASTGFEVQARGGGAPRDRGDPAVSGASTGFEVQARGGGAPRDRGDPAVSGASTGFEVQARAESIVAMPDPSPPVAGSSVAGSSVRGSSVAGSSQAGPVAETNVPGWVVVKPGDSLWLLAERHLGDALLWEDIYDLNSGPLPGGGTLRDPNLIHPGWRLRLPPPVVRASSVTAGGALD